MRIFSFVCLTAFLISTATAAEPAAEMANFSVFSGINVADLAKGEPKVAHGPALSGHFLKNFFGKFAAGIVSARVLAANLLIH